MIQYPSAQYYSIAPDYKTSRIIKGCWQLAGDHGRVDAQRAIAHMEQFFDAGIRHFDCADIYTGVEEMIGQFRTHLKNARGTDAANTFKVHTKLVPNLQDLPLTTTDDIVAIVERSLKRLKQDRLDLLQFYWWDLSLGKPYEVLSCLGDLQKQGKIHKLGVCNWNHHQIQPFLDVGLDITTAQVQYSVLDNRPAGDFANWCTSRNMSMVCYGSLAGGFLTEGWMGQPDPGFQFSNRSLVKYRLIIDEFGSWDMFQTLLQVLQDIAHKHRVNLSAVASRYVIQQPAVAGAIVGARYAHHLPKTMQVFSFELDKDDMAKIQTIIDQAQGPKGLVYALEQDRTGRHGAIMKYHLG